MCVRAAEGCRCAGSTTSEAESVSQGHMDEGTHAHTEDTDMADPTDCLRKSPAEHAHSALQVHRHTDICDVPGVPAQSLYTTGTSAWILTPLTCPTGYWCSWVLPGIPVRSTHTLVPQIPHVKYQHGLSACLRPLPGSEAPSQTLTLPHQPAPGTWAVTQVPLQPPALSPSLTQVPQAYFYMYTIHGGCRVKPPTASVQH